MCNKWSRDENLVRAVICAGLYPGISSVVVRDIFPPVDSCCTLYLTIMC